jgi:hypothetical protein
MNVAGVDAHGDWPLRSPYEIHSSCLYRGPGPGPDRRGRRCGPSHLQNPPDFRVCSDPEARMLEVSIFHALDINAHRIDFNVVLPDVMVIADEVDSQLAQATESYTAVLF